MPLPALAIPLVTTVAPIIVDLVFKKSENFFSKQTKLDEDEQERSETLIAVCARVAFADEVVEDSELAIINSIFSYMKEKDLDKKIRFFIKNPIDLESLPKIFIKKTERIEVWKIAYSIAISDNEYHEQEKKLINEISQILKLDIQETETLAREIDDEFVKKCQESENTDNPGILNKGIEAGGKLFKGLSKGVQGLWDSVDKDKLKDMVSQAVTKKIEKKAKKK